MTNIETLLRRYAEGTLTPEQQAELDALTHRQQVWQAANQQATDIRRRRRGSIAAVVSLCVVSAVFVLLRPASQGVSDAKPVVAQVQPQSVAPTDAPMAINVAMQDSPDQEMLHVESVVEHTVAETVHASRQVASHPADVMPVANPVEPADQTIVACNTQCSPDSVINDIWNFLRA